MNEHKQHTKDDFPCNANNLMASGGIRNVGVDELDQNQCNRMP